MEFNCESCGAVLGDSMARCPYCGTLIAEGAQREYMQKLENVRRELDALQDLPQESVKAELRHQGRRMRKIILAALLLILILMGLFFLQSRSYERDNTADYVWGRENFPHMSQLYESGEYEALYELVMQAMDDDRPIWNWEYYDEFFELMEALP